MGVDVHRQDALAVDLDRQARGPRLGVGGIQQTATAKRDPLAAAPFKKFRRVVIGRLPCC